MQSFKTESRYFTSVSEITSIFYFNKFKHFFKKEDSILDFGCGTGELLNLINCKYKCGIEINKLSQKKLINKKIFFFSNLKNLKKKFNLIFALSVIDHLVNPAFYIKELVKKLRKNGKLIIIIRHDSKNQTTSNSIYRKHLYSWSLLSFSNLIKKLNIKILEHGVIKMTLPPKFSFLKKIFNIKFILILSKIYFYLNFKDRRFYFICTKK